MSTPRASDWAARYTQDHTPWDLGDAHPELAARLSTGALGAPGRAFVPGCGRGHDAAALAGAGWDVVALDYAPSLEEPLTRRMNAVGGRAVIGDAFTYDGGPFDLIFDHTFFCAIPPERRHDLGRLATDLVEPGGRFISVVFPIGRREPGPPWGVTVAMLDEALGEEWSLRSDEPARNPPGRRWAARWAEWERQARSEA